MSQKKEPRPPRHSWIVRARVEQIVEYVTEDCTEQEAREGYDSVSLEERVIETIESEFVKMEPNI